MTEPLKEPTEATLSGIVRVQAAARPFHYPNGLVEVPICLVSDVNAFRTGRWKLDRFLTAVRRVLESAIARRTVFDILAHPSCLGVVDPGFKAVDLILDLVERSEGKATIVGLDSPAERARG